MLVLLVSVESVVVDDARPTPDGTPPDHLLFDGPLVEGDGGRMLPGLDVVYRLVERVNLDPKDALGRWVHSDAVERALEHVKALPVYLRLSDGAARAWREANVTGHPVAHVPGPRPHLQLAPPPIPDVLLRDDERPDEPTYDALTLPPRAGDPFCLWCDRAGKPSPHPHESDGHPDEPVDRRDQQYRRQRSVAEILLGEANRCRDEAREATPHNPERARELLEAAVGYERAAGVTGRTLQQDLARSAVRDAIAPLS